jgi:hypothetical protein
MDKDIQLLQEAYKQINENFWQPFDNQGKSVKITNPLDFVNKKSFKQFDIQYDTDKEAFIITTSIGRALIPWEKTKYGNLRFTPRTFDTYAYNPDPKPETDLGYDDMSNFEDEFYDSHFKRDPKIDSMLNKIIPGLHIGSMISYDAIAQNNKMETSSTARVTGVSNDGKMITALTNVNFPKWYFTGELPEDEILVDPKWIAAYNWF